MSLPTLKRELEFELSDEKYVTIEVEIYVDHDPNMNADADGNRGIDVWSVDDIDYKMPEKDDDGVALTDADKKDLEEKIEKEVRDLDIEDECRNEWD